MSLGVCAFRWYGEVVWFLSLHLDIEKITNSPLSVPPFLHLKVLTDRHREAVSRNHFLVLFHTESARCFDLINKLENIQITQVLPHWLKPVLVSRSESTFLITAGTSQHDISMCDKNLIPRHEIRTRREINDPGMNLYHLLSHTGLRLSKILIFCTRARWETKQESR